MYYYLFAIYQVNLYQRPSLFIQLTQNMTRSLTGIYQNRTCLFKILRSNPCLGMWFFFSLFRFIFRFSITNWILLLKPFFDALFYKLDLHYNIHFFMENLEMKWKRANHFWLSQAVIWIPDFEQNMFHSGTSPSNFLPYLGLIDERTRTFDKD